MSTILITFLPTDKKKIKQGWLWQNGIYLAQQELTNGKLCFQMWMNWCYNLWISLSSVYHQLCEKYSYSNWASCFYLAKTPSSSKRSIIPGTQSFLKSMKACTTSMEVGEGRTCMATQTLGTGQHVPVCISLNVNFINGILSERYLRICHSYDHMHPAEK